VSKDNAHSLLNTFSQSCHVNYGFYPCSGTLTIFSITLLVRIGPFSLEMRRTWELFFVDKAYARRNTEQRDEYLRRSCLNRNVERDSVDDTQSFEL
jgi:hypothetical protein